MEKNKTINIIDFSKLVLLFTHTVKEVAITQMKLQKMVYLCQALHYSAFDELLFQDKPQAWVHGPVYPILYEKYRYLGYKEISLPDDVNNYITSFEENANDKGNDIDFKDLFTQYANEKLSITNNEHLDFLYQVLDHFSDLTAAELRNLTHKDTAWLEAREGLPEFAKGEFSMNYERSKMFFKQFITHGTK